MTTTQPPSEDRLQAVLRAGEQERARLQREEAIAAQRLKAQVWKDEAIEAIREATQAWIDEQKPFAYPKWRKMRYQYLDAESAAEWIYYLVLNSREQEAEAYLAQSLDTARRGPQDKLRQEQEAAERAQEQERIAHEKLHQQIFGSDDEGEGEEDEEVIEVVEAVAVPMDTDEPGDAGDAGDDSDDADDPDKIYTVERILKDKTVKGKKRYLVKWEGYDSSHNSWEPPESFFDKSPIAIYENHKLKVKQEKNAAAASVAKPSAQEEADAALARALQQEDRRSRTKPMRIDPQFGRSNVAVKYRE
jgi:hypothetical protein